MKLTPRELDCLHWASYGKTSWEIGRILGIAERTANFHLSNTCAKLAVCNRMAAITAAIKLGLLPDPNLPGEHFDKMESLQTLPGPNDHEPGLTPARAAGSAPRATSQHPPRRRKGGTSR
ncbi:LuxR C-terminal-related transcriptional regulator [Castellaniella sp.]|uniref:helix-turn-helix domain-containing protein n=1 Tax=Castellaniella sp. TaxID=1955812 RepID=UPI0035613A62